MLMKVLKYPDPFLSTKAEPVSKVDDSIKAIIHDMFDTMYSEGGIGLAAVQVGVPLRIATLDMRGKQGYSDYDRNTEWDELKPERIAFINPVIYAVSNQKDYMDEGCLSVPGVREQVTRPQSIVVNFLNYKGEESSTTLTGLPAVCLQHEIDHLDGILFIDLIDTKRRKKVDKRLLP